MDILIMIIVQCKRCFKQFKARPYSIKKGFSKYCSSKCYHLASIGTLPWNKGIKGWQKRVLTGKYIKCKYCGAEKYFEKNQLRKRPCLYCSVLCARKDNRKDKLKYSSLHSRIRIDWGKANHCEYCSSNKNVDWANKSGDYLFKREDWIMLCRKHHIAYDRGILKI